MSILDSLLGGNGEQSTAASFDSVIATNPGVALHGSDILSASTGGQGDDGGLDFTGIGDIGLGLSAPTVIGLSGSVEQSSSGDVNAGGSSDGGLLGGLL